MTGKDGDVDQIMKLTQDMIDLIASANEDFGNIVSRAAQAVQGKF